MIRLSMTQRKWLLTAHIAFVAPHLGALLSLLVLNVLVVRMPDSELLKAIYPLTGKLDMVLVPATGLGMLVTGLFVHKPAMAWLVALAVAAGSGPLLTPEFLAARSADLGALTLELVLVAALLPVSVLKPWGVRRSTAPGRPATR